MPVTAFSTASRARDARGRGRGRSTARDGRARLAGGAVVRARMGLHTGEPTSRGERATSEWTSTARRGSRRPDTAARSCCRRRRAIWSAAICPRTATLTDLGEHWLKDLAEPEHLYQLSVEGLPRHFRRFDR